MGTMNVWNTKQAKAYEYKVSVNEELLKKASGKKISMFIQHNKSKVDPKRVGFSAVVTVEGRYTAIEISGISYDGSINRSHIRAFLIAVETLYHFVKTTDLVLYIGNHFLYKILKYDWALNWLRNGFLRQDGYPVMNQDLMQPLAKILYANEFVTCIKEMKDFRTFIAGDEEYNVRRSLIRINNIARQNVYGNTLA